MDNSPVTIQKNSTKHKVKQGASRGVDGAVLATPAAKGSDSSPTPLGASSFNQGTGSRSLPGAAEGGVGGTDCYLESYDNVSSWLVLAYGNPDPLKEVNRWLDNTCDKNGVGWFIAGECENGHRFAKELVCGKEFCGVCGEDDSIAHLRRFARWLPKAQQFEVMGYFVFTIPQELRAKYRTKKALGKLGHQVQELLKSYGHSRGLRRWHWFGDIAKWGLRVNPVFHPHLNCLVDGGFISEKKVAAIKCAYASLLGADVVDVNYRYRRLPGKMVHTLKYVTRATFRDYDLDLEMAMELRGFRNMVVWGRGQWDDPPVWSLADLGDKAEAEAEDIDIEAINSLAAGACPVCGKALAWGEALPIGLLTMVEKQPLGAGYYRLADVRPPPGLPPDIKQRLYWMDLIHGVEVRVAIERAEAEARAEATESQGWWASLLNETAY